MNGADACFVYYTYILAIDGFLVYKQYWMRIQGAKPLTSLMPEKRLTWLNVLRQ